MLIDPTTLDRDYGRLIKKILFRRTKSPDVVDDLTQEVYVRILEKFHQYKSGRGKVGTWIARIAINLQNDYLRESINRGVMDLDVERGDIRIDSRVSYFNSLTPEDILLNDERIRIIRQEIDKLPSIHREAVVLMYYHNFTGEEIGDALNLSSKRIYAILKEAREKLKPKLKQYQ